MPARTATATRSSRIWGEAPPWFSSMATPRCRRAWPVSPHRTRPG
jgi:hypothetical protein